MSNWNASEVQVTTTTATIKWSHTAPNEQMQVRWKPHSGSTWTGSGTLASGVYTYQITGLSGNSEYDVVLDPQNLPNGGTDWWASQGSFWTDFLPTVNSVTIDGGAGATNLAQATLSIQATAVDSPVVAYGLSNNGTSYTWYAYPAGGKGAGLLGAYYANPSDTSYGQSISDNFYLAEETDPQVNISWPTNVPGFLSSGDPGDANWGSVWQGDLFISQTGRYNFAVPSGDGAALVINGSTVFDNWAVQTAPGSPYTGESGSVTFNSVGVYQVSIFYFQGNTAQSVQLLWQPPGAPSYSLVPSANLIAVQHGSPTAGSTSTIPTTWGLTGNGSVTVYAEVETADGQISAPVTASINLLTGAQNPVLRLALDNGASTTTNPAVSYVITATGAGLPTSGQSEYQVNGGAWSGYQPFSQTGTVTLPSSAGVYTVNFQVEDGNGLTSQAAAQITLQPAPPPAQNAPSQNGVAGTYNGKSVYFVNNQNVSLTVSNASNPATMNYSFDGVTFTATQPFNQNLSLVLPKGDGLSPVYVDTFDSRSVLVGQSTTYYVEDMTPPTIESLVSQSGADATSGTSINLVVTAKDNITQPSNLLYAIDGGSESVLPSTGLISAPVSSPGINNITVDIFDQAQNLASETIQIIKLA